jgi:exonuclease SbcC
VIIRSVKLTNILSHEDSEITFPDGIIAIVGPNGAGKSSIVDSIYIALFTEARPDIRGMEKEFIVMRGKKRGEISVVLEVSGVKYLVVRELNVDTPAQAYLYLLEGSSRKVKAYGVLNVPKELGRVLGLVTVDSKGLRDIVRSTIIALQDELTEIIDIRDSERRERILSLLGLSYLEKSLSVIKELTKEKDRLEGVLISEKRSLEEKRNELKELHSMRSKYLTQKREEELSISRLRDKRDSYVRNIALVEEALEVCNELRNLMIYNRIKELEDTVSKLGVVDVWDPSKYSLVTKELSKAYEELNNIQNTLTSILKEVSTKVGVVIDNYEVLNMLINDLRRRRDELSTYIERLRALKDIYTIYLGKFESTSKCPICGSLITNPEDIKRRLANELSSLEDNIKSIKQEYASVDAKISVVEKSLNTMSRYLGKKEVVLGRVNEVRSQVESLNDLARKLCSELLKGSTGMVTQQISECVESLNMLKDKLLSLRKELDFLRSYEVSILSRPERVGIDDLSSRLEKLLAGIGLQVGTPKELKDFDKLISELSLRRKELQGELNKVIDELSKAEGRLKSLEDRLADVDERIKSLDSWIKNKEKEVSEVERKIRSLRIIDEFSRKYLGKDGLIAKELTRVARLELERRANKILSRLGLRPIEISDDFRISVKVLNESLPISNASGGERVGIAIALRLALAELVMGRSPTVLILDEPTIYLDADRRTQVFEVIKELGKSLKQVVVVTHDESVVDIADKVIRVENDGGVSRVISN